MIIFQSQGKSGNFIFSQGNLEKNEKKVRVYETTTIKLIVINRLL